MAPSNIFSAQAARPSDAFLSNYSAMLRDGASMTISAERLDALSVSEMILLCEALKPIEAVIDAFACQSRFAKNDRTLNRPGEVVCHLSDFVLELRQAIACRIEHATPTNENEASKRAFFVLEYAAWCGENLPRIAALGAALAMEDAAREGAR